MNMMEMATNLLKIKSAPGNGISPGLPSDGGDGDEVDDGDVQIGIGENIARFELCLVVRAASCDVFYMIWFIRDATQYQLCSFFKNFFRKGG